MTVEQVLKRLRANGWSVAVHNDYRQDDQYFTFWLFTHGAGIWIKGEGGSDLEALTQCEAQARKVFAPSP